jgi:hypothetical protein
MKQSEALEMISKIQLAHEAMESACKRIDELKEENKNLKEALAKQEQGEPAFYAHDGYLMTPDRAKFFGFPLDGILALYTTPQPAQKPLSEAAIEGLAKFVAIDDFNYDFARAIEKAHGIKENT